MNMHVQLERIPLTVYIKSPGGGPLGIFWVGMCRPGIQIGTPF